MRDKKALKLLTCVCVITIITPFAIRTAAADETAHPASQEGYFIPATFPTHVAWRHEGHDFNAEEPTAYEASGVQSDTDLLWLKDKATYSSSFKEENNAAETMLEKLPYKKQFKQGWKIVSGKEDLYFQNLRVDRSNRGLTYKTSYMPFMDDTDGIQWKAELGEDTKLTFKSDRVPLIGRVKGLEFKAAAGEDSALSLRYKRSLR